MIKVLYNLIGQAIKSLMKIKRYINHKTGIKMASNQVTDNMACPMKAFNEGE